MSRTHRRTAGTIEIEINIKKKNIGLCDAFLFGMKWVDRLCALPPFDFIHHFISHSVEHVECFIHGLHWLFALPSRDIFSISASHTHMLKRDDKNWILFAANMSDLRRTTEIQSRRQFTLNYVYLNSWLNDYKINPHRNDRCDLITAHTTDAARASIEDGRV